MTGLMELYQQVILDHNRHPRNFGVMETADRTAAGENPLCGDKIEVFLKLDGERIQDVRFVGEGCAITRASASLMTDAVKGKSVSEAAVLFGKFHDLVARGQTDGVSSKGLGKLKVLGGVRQFPARVKCANLPWHTLNAALTMSTESVSTE